MTAVITAPCWEWRMFAPKLEGWRVMPERASQAAFPSTDTYILSQFSPHCVTLTHGRVDVVTLGARAHDGLEIWIPEVSAAFPIDKQTRAAVNAIGFDISANTGYPEALKQMLDVPTLVEADAGR